MVIKVSSLQLLTKRIVPTDRTAPRALNFELRFLDFFFALVYFYFYE